jgi:superfamily II DNA or RNA helicase
MNSSVLATRIGIIGYIYVRSHESYDKYNICKLGKTENIPSRGDVYATGEPVRGVFDLVYEVQHDEMSKIEASLQTEFRKFHFNNTGGKEFYDRKIMNLIEPYLIANGFNYKKLTKRQIDILNRTYRIKKLMKKINIQELIKILKLNGSQQTYPVIPIDTIVGDRIEPSEHQQRILEIIEGFFYLHNIGKIIWACGLGKALLSILIVHLLKFKSVLIGVPSNNLQKQIKKEILKKFTNKNNILFVGGDENDGIKSTTDKREIIKFLNNNLNDQPKFVISTYHSCHLLLDKNIVFEFKIGDEAHHLVGIEREENRGFRLFHKIISSKTLFMTATEKTIETRTNKEIYSMDDETIFGKCIDNKSVNWAIENKKITDYNILVLKNTEDEVDEIVSSLGLSVINKELFISCYMCLKSFEKYDELTHLLLYTNTTEEAELCKKYINEILLLNILSIQEEQIYNNALHSKNCNNLDSELRKFRISSYGIISCVYIFGEGFDEPKLNGVCIAGNMQSEIRIGQYVLRPNRLDFENPNKKAYVIIPYIDTDDWETENRSYEKVRNIVSQMRNQDENIKQKIVVSVGKKEKKKIVKKDKQERRICYQDYIFEENSRELHKIKLRLRYSKSLGSKFTEEQDEYNYVRSINSTLNIKSKKEYIERKANHNNFIAFPEEYFKLKGVWNNWYDFMGVDTTKFIQSKHEWINFCKEKSIKSLDDYYMACEEHDILPKEPDEFYSHFTNIQTELGFNKIRRR